MNRSSVLLISSLFILSLSMATADTAYAGLSSVSHKVVRSDGSKATSSEKHEFNGGSRDFFKSIDEPNSVLQWIEEKTDTTYQEGWERLYLDWPVRINSIVLRKASVGKRPFHDGWIKLEVQPIKGKWVTVFKRKGKDVQGPVTISKELKTVGPIKGVRIVFRSPSQITVGPIDVNF